MCGSQTQRGRLRARAAGSERDGEEEAQETQKAKTSQPSSPPQVNFIHLTVRMFKYVCVR